MNFPKETLAGMYHTDLPFLESVKAPVMGRKFNYIPALTMDPPRILTDGINVYTRERRSEQGVLSDFPKSMASAALNQLFEDGDYNDIVRGINADYDFNQETLNAKFKPSDVYQFMRADAERYTDETIRDFFATQYEDKEEQKRDFMADYGVSPADAEMILRKQRIEVAEAALKEFNAGRITMRPQGPRVARGDLMAKNFMRNDVPMIEGNNYFSPDGNLVPGITGLELGGGARPARAGRFVGMRRSGPGRSGMDRAAFRASAEEDVRDRAIDGLPIIPVVEAEREAKLARLGSFAARYGAKKAVAEMRENLRPREMAAREREERVGESKKLVEMRYAMQDERSAQKLPMEEAQRRLKATARRLGVATARGRPAGSPATSPAEGAGKK